MPLRMQTPAELYELIWYSDYEDLDRVLVDNFAGKRDDGLQGEAGGQGQSVIRPFRL